MILISLKFMVSLRTRNQSVRPQLYPLRRGRATKGIQVDQAVSRVWNVVVQRGRGHEDESERGCRRKGLSRVLSILWEYEEFG